MKVRPAIRFKFRIPEIGIRSSARFQIPNFERLVLGCIEGKFCNHILVGKLLTRSIGLTVLCTSPSSEFRWDPYMKLTVKLTPPLKLWKDRSRLYRRRFLQPRPHFSAFFENCTIYTPSHRSNLKIFKISHNISVKFSRFLNHFLQNSVDTSSNLLFFAEIFTDFCRNFAEYQQF